MTFAISRVVPMPSPSSLSITLIRERGEVKRNCTVGGKAWGKALAKCMYRNSSLSSPWVERLRGFDIATNQLREVSHRTKLVFPSARIHICTAVMIAPPGMRSTTGILVGSKCEKKAFIPGISWRFDHLRIPIVSMEIETTCLRKRKTMNETMKPIRSYRGSFRQPSPVTDITFLSYCCAAPEHVSLMFAADVEARYWSPSRRENRNRSTRNILSTAIVFIRNTVSLQKV
jgi:hypothetical protein